jgi:predicted aspartyl protease
VEARLIISLHYPYLEIWFRVRSYEEQISAYIDTGFDGYLILPSVYRRRLGPGDYLSRWELGDGSLAAAEEYLGMARIVGFAKDISARIACLGNECLVGRGIIDRFRITFDRGQRIEVEH